MMDDTTPLFERYILRRIHTKLLKVPLLDDGTTDNFNVFFFPDSLYFLISSIKNDCVIFKQYNKIHITDSTNTLSLASGWPTYV